MSEEIIRDFEANLNLRRPEGGPFGCRVLGYGEVSVVLSLNAMPGKALKRISGFNSERETREYIALTQRYMDSLNARGIAVLPTTCHAIHENSHVVYFVQPAVERELLGDWFLQSPNGEDLPHILEQVLDSVAANLRANKTDPDGFEVAADAQLSNWYLPENNGTPLLVDIGSPIVRIDGNVNTSCFADILYRSFPLPLHVFLNYVGIVERYYDDYFDLRLTTLDILGNFIKEKASHRLPEGIDTANNWLARQPEREDIKPIRIDDVYRYYRKDSFLLETMTHLRRLTRFWRTRIFRQRYDYILPGIIDRR